MEIFNTLGQILTTPNTEVANIVCAPLIIVEAIVSMLLFTTILNITASKKQKVIYLITISGISIISRFIIPDPYRYFYKYDYFTIFSILATSF